MTNEMIAAALFPALIAMLAIALLRRTPWSVRLADHPNERSLHAVPTPRVGGLGILAGVFPFTFVASSPPLPLILGCALFLCLLSLADDLQSLPVQVRLAAHFAAAAVVASTWPAGLVALVPGVLAIMWATNLFNFMDGSDGLAGGMALFGFGAYGIAALLAGQPALALVSIALASASVGFLAHNFPPARVFLGDAGSIPLGFLAAALGAQGVASGAWPLAFPFLVFSPFAVDATLTLLRRMLRREKLWRAHRSHYYQRLVLAGWTRRRLAMTAYALMLAAAASALVLARADFMLRCGIIFGWVVAYALLFLVIDRLTTTTAETTH